MTDVVTVREYECIPLGEYQAEIIGKEDTDGQYGPQKRWTFQIVNDEEFEGRTLGTWTATYPTRANKLGQLLQGVGIEVEPGVNVDLDALIGEQLMLEVVTEPKKSDPSVDVNTIHRFKPIRRRHAPPEPPPPADGEIDPFATRQHEEGPLKPAAPNGQKPAPELQETASASEDVRQDLWKEIVILWQDLTPTQKEFSLNSGRRASIERAATLAVIAHPAIDEKSDIEWIKVWAKTADVQDMADYRDWLTARLADARKASVTK